VVNIEAELAKLEEKKNKTTKTIEQLQEKMNAPDYATKVKQDAKDRNDATLKSLTTEIEAITTSIANFMKL
jgi:valyl-tRNA synthetase